MTSFTLPSGRVVEMREESEITFGQELHVVCVGLKDPEEFQYAKALAVAPGMTREEIEALNREDGRAFSLEVNRIWNHDIPLIASQPNNNGKPSEGEVA